MQVWSQVPSLRARIAYCMITPRACRNAWIGTRTRLAFTCRSLSIPIDAAPLKSSSKPSATFICTADFASPVNKRKPSCIISVSSFGSGRICTASSIVSSICMIMVQGTFFSSTVWVNAARADFNAWSQPGLARCVILLYLILSSQSAVKSTPKAVCAKERQAHIATTLFGSEWHANPLAIRRRWPTHTHISSRSS